MHKYLYLLCALIGTLHADLDQGGHTHYSLRQYDTGLGREQSLWHTHTTTDIGNERGISLQAVPFISFATNTAALARHFCHNATQALTIASDRLVQHSETTLPYHALKHNTADTPAEESAIITLDPSLTVAGATLSLFHDAAATQPGLSCLFTVPVFYIDAHIDHSGSTATMNNYFAGAFSQDAPLQENLSAGQLGGQHHFKLGPVSGQLTYNVVESARSFAGGTLGFSFGFNKTSTQKHLLSGQSIANDGHKIFLGFDAGTTMLERDSFRAELMISARYGYLFSCRQNRILGVMEDDGSTPVHSPYLLGAQKGVRGTFPLANVLQREVTRWGNHQLETNMMAAFTWRAWTANIGYNLFARRAEAISVTEWPEDQYAITYPTYDTSTAFANIATTGGVDDILLNHRFISHDMLNLDTPATPAQVSATVFASAGYNGTFKSLPVLLGLGASYEHSFVDASPSMMTIWGKVGVSF